MRQYLVSEVEYPEGGSMMVGADNVDEAARLWRQATGTAEEDAPNLSITLVTPEIDAERSAEDARLMRANAGIALHLSAGVFAHGRKRLVDASLYEAHCDEVAEACERYLAAHKTVKAGAK